MIAWTKRRGRPADYHFESFVLFRNRDHGEWTLTGPGCRVVLGSGVEPPLDAAATEIKAILRTQLRDLRAERDAVNRMFMRVHKLYARALRGRK